MKLYLVRSLYQEFNGCEAIEFIYGAFSTKEKADEIVSKLRKNFEESNLDDEKDVELIVDELELDTPTKDYEFIMNS